MWAGVLGLRLVPLNAPSPGEAPEEGTVCPALRRAAKVPTMRRVRAFIQLLHRGIYMEPPLGLFRKCLQMV